MFTVPDVFVDVTAIIDQEKEVADYARIVVVLLARDAVGLVTILENVTCAKLVMNQTLNQERRSFEAIQGLWERNLKLRIKGSG